MSISFNHKIFNNFEKNPTFSKKISANESKNINNGNSKTNSKEKYIAPTLAVLGSLIVLGLFKRNNNNVLEVIDNNKQIIKKLNNIELTNKPVSKDVFQKGLKNLEQNIKCSQKDAIRSNINELMKKLINK